jgi:hypothetical protein
MVVVEGFEVVFQQELRHGVVKLSPRVVSLFKETTYGDHDLSWFGLFRAHDRIDRESRYREEPEEGSLELHGKVGEAKLADLAQSATPPFGSGADSGLDVRARPSPNAKTSA